jgi:hypothetical protein
MKLAPADISATFDISVASLASLASQATGYRWLKDRQIRRQARGINCHQHGGSTPLHIGHSALWCFPMEI